MTAQRQKRTRSGSGPTEENSVARVRCLEAQGKRHPILTTEARKAPMPVLSVECRRRRALPQPIERAARRGYPMGRKWHRGNGAGFRDARGGGGVIELRTSETSFQEIA